MNAALQEDIGSAVDRVLKCDDPLSTSSRTVDSIPDEEYIPNGYEPPHRPTSRFRRDLLTVVEWEIIDRSIRENRLLKQKQSTVTNSNNIFNNYNSNNNMHVASFRNRKLSDNTEELLNYRSATQLLEEQQRKQYELFTRNNTRSWQTEEVEETPRRARGERPVSTMTYGKPQKEQSKSKPNGSTTKLTKTKSKKTKKTKKTKKVSCTTK